MKNHSHRRPLYLIPFAVIGFLALFTFAVYALWNGVLAEVLAVKTITFWQALGLLVLAKILFGGFPGRCGRCGPPWRRQMMSEHWAKLSPEEREKMRNEVRRRFGDWPRPPWCDSDPDDEKHGEPSKPPAP